MGRTGPNAAIEQVLDALPTTHLRGRCGLAHLVLGENGGFVLLSARPDPLPAARLACRLVDETRASIVDQLGVAPFIDAIVVSTSRQLDRCGPAVAVALDLVPDLLVQGPPIIGSEVVRSVAALLADHRLGPWTAARARPDGRIVLCDPPAATASPT